MPGFIEKNIKPDLYQYGVLKESSILSPPVDLVNIICQRILYPEQGLNFLISGFRHRLGDTLFKRFVKYEI